MPSRFTQYGGALGADQALRQMVAERIAAQMEAEKVNQERYKLGQEDRRIQQSGAEAKSLQDYRTATLKDAVLNRESQRVDRMHEDAMPYDPQSPEDAALYRKHGRGGALRTATAPIVTPAQSANAPNDDPTDPTIVPGIKTGDTYHRGGSKYLAGREAAADRAAAQQATIAAQNERADESNALRLTIAQLAQSGNATSQALANQLKQIQIQNEKDKQDAATKDRDNARTAAQSTAGNAVAIVDRLLANPSGIAKATGAYELRGFTQAAQDARADINTLVDSLSLPNLGQLKGPLSDKDIVFVRNTVTKLQNPNISDRAAIDELKRLKPILERAYTNFGGAITAGGGASAGSGQAPAAPPGWKYVPKAGGGWTAVEAP